MRFEANRAQIFRKHSSINSPLQQIKAESFPDYLSLYFHAISSGTALVEHPGHSSWRVHWGEMPEFETLGNYQLRRRFQGKQFLPLKHNRHLQKSPSHTSSTWWVQNSSKHCRAFLLIFPSFLPKASQNHSECFAVSFPSRGVFHEAEGIKYPLEEFVLRESQEATGRFSYCQ